MEELRMGKPVATEKKVKLIEVKTGTVMGGYRVKVRLVAQITHDPGYEPVATIIHGPFIWSGQGATDEEAVEDVITGIGDCKQSMERLAALDKLHEDSVIEMKEMQKVIERIDK